MSDAAPGTHTALVEEVASAEGPAAAAAPSSSSSSSSYTFERAEKSWAAFSSDALKEGWTKWGLASQRSQACVRLTGLKFDPSEAPAFLLDLFNSPALRDQLPPGVAGGAPVVVTRVRFAQLNTRAVSLSFFDRLCETGGGDAVHEGGSIRKRLDDEVDGVVVGDLLRQAFLDPDGESAGYTGEHDFSGLYSAMERGELLYKVMKWVVTGGAVCQYEVRRWGGGTLGGGEGMGSRPHSRRGALVRVPAAPSLRGR
jgi:hypothetical protein